jgi:hypothetical protein
MRVVIDPASPQRALPMVKMTMATWNRRLRPKRSPSFPHSGVDTVVVSR